MTHSLTVTNALLLNVFILNITLFIVQMRVLLLSVEIGPERSQEGTTERWREYKDRQGEQKYKRRE